MTEELAIARSQNGDRDAFRYLVERYKDVLYGTACLMTDSKAHAEEHVQEALFSAWRGIRGFRKGRPFKPWLLRILVNVVLAHQRRRSRSALSAEADDRPEAPTAVAGAAASQEDWRPASTALAGLNAEHRQVVVLRYFAGLTTSEIAGSLNVTEGTVKSRLNYALGNL